MSFTHLKDLIPKAAGKFQLQGELKAAMVINRASSLIKERFSEELNREIRVKSFKQGILWLSVSNAAVAQELQRRSYTLQKDLNASLGGNTVQGMRSFQETPAQAEEYYDEIEVDSEVNPISS